MKKQFYFFSVVLLTIGSVMGLSSCSKDDDDNDYDANSAQAAAVVAQFVDHTVTPTYTALAAKAELLADQLAALKENATDAGVRQACTTFLEARAEWERSEAFLYGAAGDFGIDPHIDSWPLSETDFNTLMASPAMLNALDGEDGDAYAGDHLGNALLGFHGIEYILFANGQPKAASLITDLEWIYVVAVAGDLRNRCYQLEVSWIGDDAPASHIEKLDDLEMQYTLGGSDASYGDNIKNAGKAGSTYSSMTAALMQIARGCIDIADEVGSSKIGAAFTGENVNYIESPYSQMSITDFLNNLKSIENAYMGGVENDRDESLSLHSYIHSIDANLDAKVLEALESAQAAVGNMPVPFVNNISAQQNGVAMEACAELSSVMEQVVDALRNN